jgi:Carboxypeptidase regulatory-like domain/TonB dependent receptor
MVVSTSLPFAKSFTLALVLLAVPVMAQSRLGTVHGTVQDASMAVVPNARVTLTETATGVERNAETNAAGVYHFGGVAVGPYRLVVEAARFKKWEGTLTVRAGQTVAVDPTVEVGSLEATVKVTGAAPVVTTEGGAVSDHKEDLRIHTLPLNGRQISNLFDLTPGVEGGGNPRVNGMKVGSTEMTLDGISYVDRFGGGISRVQPGLDSIQEFHVETAGAGAQFSRPATVELVTRSGTNKIHGALFETFRNNAAGLRARQRQDLDIDPVTHKVISAKLIRNEYGGWAGGPVFRNKTFWFFNWEGMKRRESHLAITGVPTPAMWGGDLSNLTDASGDQYALYDPLTTNANITRTPFHGNIIPESRISQFARSMQAISPLPSGPNAEDNPWLGPNFQTYYAQPDDQRTFTIKGDHVFSEKDNLSARYTQSIDANSVAGGRYGYPKPGCTNCGGSGRSNSAVYSTFARWNHVFNPTFFNEIQLSSHRSTHSNGSLGDDINWADRLGLPNPFGATGWPTICTDAYNLLYYGCWDGDNRADQNLTAFQIDDNVTWVKGRHSVKFGFKGRKEFNNVRELQQTEGNHSLNGDWTAQFDPAAQSAVPFTGNGFATMLLGLPSYLSNQYNRGYFYFQQKELGLYVNDTFKVTPRLIVDYGLRWDAWTPYKEKYDRLINLDISNYIGKFQVITPHNTTMESMPGVPPAVLESWKLRGLAWVTANSIGFPGALTPANWRDFGPRLAVAYRVTDKWVLRAGYGTYYWPMPLSQILQSSRVNPPLNLIFQTDYSNLNGAVPFYSLSHAPAPKDFIGQAIVDINHPSDSIRSTSVGIMPWDIHHWADDKMQNWTLTIEREIMKNTSLRLSYLGTHGSNLEQRWHWNDAESEWNYQARTGLATNGDEATLDSRRPNPNWQSGLYQSPVEHNGYSNSHGVQAQAERQFSNGLAFQAFYVYSHVLTTSDSGGFDPGFSSINASGQSNGGAFAVPEDRVIMGEPNLSPSQRLRLGYYNSSEVPPHRVRWNGIYELPLGRGKKFAGNASKLTNLLVGGWHLAWIGTWQSGNWSGVSADRYLFGNPTLHKDQRLTMNIFGRRQRLWFRGDFDPMQATGVDPAKLQQLVSVDRSQRILRPLGPNFDNKLAQQLADGSVRSTSLSDMLIWNARDFYLGPVQWNEDLSAIKYFEFAERLKMRFTCDFFNLFNHPNDIKPDITTGLQDLSRQANDPRIIQFSLRLEF